MVMPKDTFQADIQKEIVENWRMFIDNLENSLKTLEKGIDEASEMTEICTSEWCLATEHVIDELSNSLFSISEPSWASEEDGKKIKALKKRLHDIYAKYKVTARSS
jgi:hypothetical protein